MLFLGFFVILLSSFLVVLLLLRPKAADKAVERRLQIIAINKKIAAESDLGLKAPDVPRGRLAERIGEYVQRFHFADDLKQLIVHAGSKASVGGVIISSLLIAIGLAFVAHSMIGFLPLDIAAAILGAVSRWGLLRFQRSRRLNKFTLALPDAIELMARALRAGHSMNSAVEIVAEQSVAPLDAEFGIVFQQQKFGIPFRDAILQLGERVPSKDLHFLITAILVQKETGGDLTEILDRTTTVIRERVRIEGEIRTYTAQGRLTGWILAGLPIAMLILINLITPGYSHILFHDPVGHELLTAGAALIVVGGFIISRIVDIQV